MSIIIAILLFSLIILFHELGHFLLAKANGIRVNEFSLGLGPTIVGFTKGETKYSIKLLPFGGACMMEGEDGESTDQGSFNNKSVWARMSVVAAGPIFNFIMAFVFAFIIIISLGYDQPVLTDVMPGYPAEEAGLQAGDEILKMNNFSIHFYNEISAYSMFHIGEEATVTYRRDGEIHQTILTPRLEEESGRYLYGFISGNQRVMPNFGQACVKAVQQVRYIIYVTLQSLKQLVTGGASVNDLSGPVGIVKEVGDTYEQSVTTDGYFYAFMNMLNWGVLLAANLGVMNLLPIPALDGGRLFFLLVEAIRRKRIDPNKEGMVHFAGIVLLMLLMIFIMFKDIWGLFIR